MQTLAERRAEAEAEMKEEMLREYTQEALLDELTSLAGIDISEARIVPEGFQMLFKDEEKRRGIPSQLTLGSGHHSIKVVQIPGELFDGFTSDEYWHRPMLNPLLDPEYLRKKGKLVQDWQYRQAKLATFWYAGVREMVMNADSMKEYLLDVGQEVPEVLMCGKVAVHQGNYKSTREKSEDEMRQWKAQVAESI